MPPANQGYMIAAYVVAAVVLVGYAVLLAVRVRKAARREQGAEPAPSAARGSSTPNAL